MARRQKGRVYQAERVLLRHGSMNMSLDWWQSYVDELVGTPWWLARWPSQRIRVEAGRLDSACATSQGDRMRLPPWARTEATVLHELAHHAIPKDGHGEEFCWAFLELVRRQLGTEAWKALREAFDDHGVRYRTVFLMGPAS